MTLLTSDHNNLKVKIKVTDQEFPAQKETAKYLFRVAEGEMKDLRTDSTLFAYLIFILLSNSHKKIAINIYIKLFCRANFRCKPPEVINKVKIL